MAVPKELTLKRQITRHVEVEKAMRQRETECGERKKKQSGFGIIIAKTRGACVIAIISPDGRWAVLEMGFAE